jgi:glutamine synthetase
LSSFAERCLRYDGAQPGEREAACAALLRRVAEERIELIRVVWCDWHGTLRGKALLPAALPGALRDGVGMVGTLLLKDTADRTAFKVFDSGASASTPVLQGLGQAGNVRLLPDPTSLTPLPWAPGQAWLRAEPWHEDASPVSFDPRRVLQRQLQRLAATGAQLSCGLELEFHVYRVLQGEARAAACDPARSTWPPPTPDVELIHPGFHLLADARIDQVDGVLATVRQVAHGLGLPLQSLEVELGPSQLEAVFGVGEALQVADQAVWFRQAVKQALRREGYLATFMGKPPFEPAVASGWHLHQSVVGLDAVSAWRSRHAQAMSAESQLGPHGSAWLAGLLAHAPGMAALASPTVSGYGRFQGGPMSPLQAVWGLDNRGAMLRVLRHGDTGDAHIENRLGESAANPYLYVASQVAAGLDGVERGLQAPPATSDPYGRAAPDAGTLAAPRLPADLGQSLDAFDADPLWRKAFGRDTVDVYLALKRAEWQRFQQSAEPLQWQRREYFERL